MFILTTNQELRAHKLMCRIIGYEHSLGLKEFLVNLICSIFGYVYIFNRLRVMSTRTNEPHYELQPLSSLKRYT
jgi:hypothetical protein